MVSVGICMESEEVIKIHSELCRIPPNEQNPPPLLSSEILIKEHMYCGSAEVKPPKQRLAPLSFFTPGLTISGEDRTSMAPQCLTSDPRRLMYVCACRLSPAGGGAVPRPASDAGHHQDPGRVLHPARPGPPGE